MVNYSQSKIYKLVCDETDDVYIGSTTKQYLCQRMSNHRRCYIQYTVSEYSYISAYEILQYPSARIELVEACPCETKDELRARERYHIDEYRSRGINVVNINVPGRTINEWVNDNREHYNGHRRKYYEANKEKFKERIRSYYEKAKSKLQEKVECPCGSVIARAQKSQHLKTKKHVRYEESLKVKE